MYGVIVMESLIESEIPAAHGCASKISDLRHCLVINAGAAFACAARKL